MSDHSDLSDKEDIEGATGTVERCPSNILSNNLCMCDFSLYLVIHISSFIRFLVTQCPLFHES